MITTERVYPAQVAAVYVRLFLQRSGLSARQLFAGTSLTELKLAQLHYIDGADHRRLMHNIDSEHSGTAWAARFGDLLTLSSHSHLGAAVLSAPDVGTAIDTLLRFQVLRATTFTSSLYECSHGRMLLGIESMLDDAAYARWMGESVIKILQNFLLTLLGGKANRELCIHFRHAKPGYEDQLASCYSNDCRFDEVFTGISFPLAWMQMPSPLVDLHSHQLHREHCAIQLDVLNKNISTRDQVLLGLRNNFTAAASTANFCVPTLNRIAESMHIAPRTLIRRLKRENCSFNALLEEVRYRMALDLLQHSVLPIAEIGRRLGFAEPGNFSRAFRRWHGSPPSSLRP